jgi:hypothetical protein
MTTDQKTELLAVLLADELRATGVLHDSEVARQIAVKMIRHRLNFGHPAARPEVDRLKEAENEWTAVKWARLGDSPHDRPSIERIGSAFGPDRYAVRRGSACLSKDGEWEYEPMPHNRDVEFFARCRFETFDAARQALAELEGK